MRPRIPKDRRQRLFLAAAALQLGCGGFFLADVIAERREAFSHVGPEALGVVALWVGAAVTLSELYRLHGRNRAVERQLAAASGAFQEVMEQSFRQWGLTPSERDVALMSIKGLSIADIARLRQTREGTVKAQNAAVYRKAGVSGRAELLSHFIEELLPGIDADRPPAEG